MMRLALHLVAVLAMLVAAAPTQAADAEVRFDTPSASGELGQPIRFTTTFSSPVAPRRVELLSRVPTSTIDEVRRAEVTGSSGSFTATLEHSPDDGHVVPNTAFVYRFRVITEAGVTLGPEARFVYRDTRFEWRTLEGRIVRLHWHEGDDAFGRRAADIADRALDQAAQLLGVTETEPVDFFIYGDQTAFQQALGPGTRENVAGQAHAYIRTMFGLLEPFELESTEVEALIEHELAHLVFDTAVKNPYHAPPRWLDEGLAVYVSEDDRSSWKVLLALAVQRDEVIPLAGLAGLFPTVGEKFRLAYGESVSAIEFFVETYGRDRLVQLIRSYSTGVTDDEAFTAATGADLAAFDAAWQRSLGIEEPTVYGPQPAPPGPVPPDWSVSGPVASPGTGATPGAVATPRTSARPGDPGPPADPPGGAAGGGRAGALPAVLVGVGAASVLALAMIALLLTRTSTRPAQPGAPMRSAPGSSGVPFPTPPPFGTGSGDPPSTSLAAAGSGADQPPGSTAVQPPGSAAVQPPGSAVERPPGATVEQPAVGTEQTPMSAGGISVSPERPRDATPELPPARAIEPPPPTRLPARRPVGPGNEQSGTAAPDAVADAARRPPAVGSDARDAPPPVSPAG